MPHVRLPVHCVITEVFGGLGNQMFQYAAGRALAVRHGVELYLSRQNLHWDTQRDYSLDRMNINARLLTPEQERRCLQIIGERNRGKRAWRKVMRHLLPGRYFKHFPDLHKSWRAEFAQLRPACYLEGYWQDQRYFADIRPTLLEEFTPADPLAGRNLELATQIRQCNAVSLHVRRGDYQQPNIAKVMAHCSLDYYRQAIAHVTSRCEKPVFFVFSDDIPWVRDNLPLGQAVVHVDHNDGQSAQEDMRLMSLCKHNIIANSTFSWWGAWLNNHPDKIVCCPDHWFHEPRLNQSQRQAQLVDWVRL